ncbi:MAG TPA: ROK family protein [Candidatus Saccharicenans sp.]|jgi:glucokinase|nr:ROK family protein [Candidatus Saccharicenans sp.]HRD02985.1 ROK family protein [Candidatus Saccharicenans sp.]
MSDRYHGYYAGFDLGGTQLKYGVIEAGGRLAFKNKVPSPPDINHLMTLIGSIWKELENKFGRKIKAAGFGFAGFYSLARKRILYSPNYQALNNFPLVPHLKKIIPVPFFIHNDANLAAFGEYIFGRGQQTQSLVFLTIGTGVGSGLILAGELWQGRGGFAGELGHITVNHEGLRCNCGNTGCLETEVSAPALVRNYLNFSGKKEERLTAKDVYLRARAGDEAARKSFDRSGYFLGIGLSIVINLLNPENIIIGGGVMDAGRWLLSPAIKEAKKRSIGESFSLCRIEKASLGNDAGLMGAAAWARQQLARQKSITSTRHKK